jgi:Domain of unknown function (DUF4388)
MVEGDLLDLTLPSLLQALAREGSTAVLRLQRESDHGVVYFCEGVPVHARVNAVAGDDAIYDLLRWPDGRFRISRDAEPQPRTISQRLATVVTAVAPRRPGNTLAARETATTDLSGDGQLLHDLLTLLTQLEQDRARLEEGRVEGGAVPALLLVTAVVNSMVALVTARCADPGVQPSRVLARLAEQHPYTQLLGSDMNRISIATAADVLNTWKSDGENRAALFVDLCRALLDVLTFYGQIASTLFHSSREREEWRATFGVFVEGLWAAVRGAQVCA